MNAPVLESQYPTELLLSELSIITWTTDLDLKVTSSAGRSLARLGLVPIAETRVAHLHALKGQTERCSLEIKGFFYEVIVSPLKNKTGQIIGAAGLATDITDQKILETQLRSSQKMDALGRLAGGIAHDFNNILTVILNYAELLELDYGKDPKAKSKLEAISNCASKAASLTNQLLAFSRQQVLKEQKIDLNILLSSVGHMLTRVIGEDIELKLELKNSLSKISADPNQILHVVLTLAQNARESMPHGGKLSICTSMNSEFVVVSFSDTGPGMDSETQKHIFESLSLAASFKIIEQNKGRIEIQSSPGKGTTFDIYFPTIDQVTKDLQESKKINGSETILVVEDEDIVRQVACDIIRGNGYTVLEATNALGALELCETSGQGVDLVLTDLVMPKMNGPELIKKISMKFPKISVVYMSGYNSDSALGNGLLKEKASFIQKPFMPKELLQVLRDTLDGQVVANA